MNELETVAWLKQGERHVQVPVVVCYELDGYKPIGLWVSDELGIDITPLISQDEYDLLYSKAMADAIEYMADAADMMEDR